MNNARPIILALAAVMCFYACASGSMHISEDLSPSELIQRAQEASDRNRYRVALQYYQVLLERNLYNIDLVCTAEYEIAFIYYKQKKYTQAKDGFNDLLERYNTPNEENLPPQFKLLAVKVLERITEKESPRSFFSRNKA
jgi:outer membrane protein assembly factor BamD (BamD/ComL family)